MKEQEIKQRLQNGVSPSALVNEGYSRGTVYKVRKRLDTGGGTPSSDRDQQSDIDPVIENDPDIVGLRKEIRLAELHRELDGIGGEPTIGQRVELLESGLTTLADIINSLKSGCDNLQKQVSASPLSGLRQEFQCGCGEAGSVAVTVHCTACGDESAWGWFPKSSE